MARKLLKHLKLLAAAVVIAAVPAVASAQPVGCAGHKELANWLQEQFKEQPVGLGLIGSHSAVELYVSSTGTWTILVTDLTGRSCILAAGNSWVSTEPPAAGETKAKLVE